MLKPPQHQRHASVLQDLLDGFRGAATRLFASLSSDAAADEGGLNRYKETSSSVETSHAIQEKQEQVESLLEQCQSLLNRARELGSHFTWRPHLPGGLATLLALRFFYSLLITRLHLARLARVLLSLAVFTLLPGLYERVVGVDSDEEEERELRVLDTARQRVERRRDDDVGILDGVAAVSKEVGYVAADFAQLTKVYWTLGSRLARLVGLTVPLMVRSGRRWKAVGRGVTDVAGLARSLLLGSDRQSAGT